MRAASRMQEPVCSLVLHGRVSFVRTLRRSPLASSTGGWERMALVSRLRCAAEDVEHMICLIVCPLHTEKV